MSNGRFCSKCGSELEPSVRFCASCGAQNETAAAPAPSFGGGDAPYSPKKKPPYAIIGIAAAVVVVALLAVMVLFGSSVKPEELNGDWTGTITITSIDGDKDFTNQMDVKSLPKEEKVNCKITLDSSGNGTFDADGLKCKAKYSGGTLTVNADETLFSMNLILDSKMSADKDNSNYTLDGKITETVKETTDKKRSAEMKGTLKLTKPIK